MFTATALRPAQSQLVSRGLARESQVRQALGPGPPSLLLPYSPRNTQSLCPEAWDPLFPAHHIQVGSAPCSLDRFFQAGEQMVGLGAAGGGRAAGSAVRLRAAHTGPHWAPPRLTSLALPLMQVTPQSSTESRTRRQHLATMQPHNVKLVVGTGPATWGGC